MAFRKARKVGYVQPIRKRADQHSNVVWNNCRLWVGAFLLAASEMVKYSKSKTSITQDAIWKDDRDNMSMHMAVIFYHKETYYCMDDGALETYDELLLMIKTIPKHMKAMPI